MEPLCQRAEGHLSFSGFLGIEAEEENE